MDSPRGLWWDHKTLYVLHPPFLSAFHDDDGDGVADREEVLVKGIGFDLKFRGADHTTNGFRMGIDGWLYIAVGDYGFTKAEGKDGKTLQLRGGGIVRVRPDGTGLETVCDGLRNIYDVAVSPTLDLFTRDNTNDGGGWDVRLSHITPTGHYGYPRLFTHFSDEIIKPLADYGGGAPCGVLYMDELGFPEGYGKALYTCDWGRGMVYRHPLKPDGSTWKAEQAEFVNVPRPTDMDVDGSGRIYVSSWKDGGFDFSKPEVGYVVRITRKDRKPIPLSTGKSNSDGYVVKVHLGSGSAVRRLNAQRELLRRKYTDEMGADLFMLAANDKSIEVRVAALFTLKQLLGAKSHDALLKLAKDDALREYALKALADDLRQLDKVPPEPFLEALKDKNPRVRVQAVIGLNRLNKPEAASALLPLTLDSDPVVAHVAVNALVSLKAGEVCLKALGTTETPGALRVLQALHESTVVDGLLSRLAEAKDDTLRRGILKTLARLYQREADWDGSWWSTRPDTTGPYYKPVAWGESAKIRKVLQEAVATADAEGLRFLIPELQRNRVDLPEVADKLLKLAETDPAFRRMAVDAFVGRPTIPDVAVPFFIEVAANPKEKGPERARALKALVRTGDNPKAIDAVLDILTKEGKLPGELEPLWAEFARDGRHVNDVARFVKLTEESSAAKRELAYAVLATIGDRNLGKPEARSTANAALATAWTKADSVVPLLQAIARLNLTSYAAQIRPLETAPDTKIAAAAKATLSALKIDPALRNLPLIGKQQYETVVTAALQEKGNVELGAKLFQRTGCVNCHSVSPAETLKGPMLAGIAERYKKPELLESILKPSAKIAQGFETHLFELTNGKKIEGFIVKEAGTEIELRDGTGASILVKKEDIEQRKTSKVSMMPEKLVDNLTVPELAAIVAYLESLKGK